MVVNSLELWQHLPCFAYSAMQEALLLLLLLLPPLLLLLLLV